MRHLIDLINLREGKLVGSPISILSDISGILLLVFIFLFICFIARKNKRLFIILSLALTIRIVVSLINYYIFPLPDSLWDSRALEHSALIYSLQDNDYLINTFGYPHYLTSMHWILSFIYYLFGRSPLLLLSFSVFLGILSIYYFYHVCLEIFSNEKIALKTSFLLVFLPTHILYSSLIMKEILIVFLIISSLYFYIRWLKYNYHFSAFLFFTIYSSLFFFHTPLLIGIAPFAIFYFYRIFYLNFFHIQYLKIS